MKNKVWGRRAVLCAGAAAGTLLALGVPAVASEDEGLEESVIKARDEMRKELGAKFRISVVETWFVVASNAGRSTHKTGETLVRRTYTAMYKEYFEGRPDKPVKIYLFGNAKTYEAYCQKTFGEPAGTPYGFYRDWERRMVMNISTGGGTLNHELIHAMIYHDFEDVPSWFNEGFAALFEGAYYTRDDKMRGMVNWRLPGLQRAMKAGDKTTLRSLMKTDTDEFYGDNSGLHYAMGRYLMMYLQDKGLLQSYYRTFRDNFKTDPTGIKSLERVTGKRLEDLEVSWRRWVRRLVYKRR